MRDFLIEGFEYDLWANLRWTPIVGQLDQAEPILRHVLQSQRIWLARCLGEESMRAWSDSLDEALKAANEDWIELIRIGDPEAFVTYERNGKTHFQTIEQISRHVINHGTYHRGQLRNLAEGMDFPETDFILFVRERA